MCVCVGGGGGGGGNYEDSSIKALKGNGVSATLNEERKGSHHRDIKVINLSL